MKLITQIKNAHRDARLDGNKVKAGVLTMLLSRADAARSTQYKVKSTDDLTDEQVIKIIQAEVTSINAEVKAFETIDPVKADKAKAELDILLPFIPKEMTDEEVLNLVKEALAQNDNLNMGTAMKAVRELYEAKAIKETLPMAKVSKVVKENI